MIVMFDIITVGSATVDVFVNTDISQKGNKIQYPIGSKILVKDLKFLTGGGGTNTAVSFSRLGLKVAYLGKIGSDENGKKILDLLKKEKVRFIGAKGEGMSGYSVILDSVELNRTILAYKGENNNLRFGDIDTKKLKTKWFYFSSMIGESFKTQKMLARFAVKNGIKIAYNPSSYQVKMGTSHLKDIMSGVYILVINKEEAYMFVGKKDMKHSLKKLRELGPEIVCITDKGNGVYAYDGKFAYTLKPHKISLRERTGAGDAFGSGFLAGIIKGNNIEFALQLGLANSESVIQHYGAKNKLLKWNEAVVRIRNSPVRIRKG